MSQTEWAARVAAIGALAGWTPSELRVWSTWPVSGMPAFPEMEWLEPPAVIAAIRQLAVDWLAAEGVVAVRVCRWECEIGAWPADLGLDWTSECGCRWRDRDAQA